MNPFNRNTPGVLYDEQTRIFRLQSKSSAYVFRIDEEENLEHLYWGEIVPSADDLTYLTKCNIPGLFDPTGIYNPDEPAQVRTDTHFVNARQNFVGKNSKLLEWSDLGTGDYREPSIKVKYSDGSSSIPLKYKNHQIYKGKPKIVEENLPSVYLQNENECKTLEITLLDSRTHLRVVLYFSVMFNYDTIIRRTQVVNDGGDPVILDKISSCTVDFDAEEEFFLTQLSGSWARERHIMTHLIQDGVSNVKSVRGTSSHQSNPFVVISPGREPEEETGDCFGFCLVYSGNFAIEMEKTEYKRLRVNVGINEELFSWHLESIAAENGDERIFCSPEVIMTHSGAGLGGISRNMHRLMRDRLVPKQWRFEVPPVLINTWEAVYFNFTHDVIVDIAKSAKGAGIELLVLDDGWFGDRNDSKSSLGDWEPNKEKLPDGLEKLVADINEIGLDFGIWVEPEMVSPNSKLFDKHEDWVLKIPGEPGIEGRNQLVLDFSRTEVVEYMFDMISKLLSSANIKYMKWDMNRHLTDIYSGALGPSRQGEVSHRFMLGVYSLFRKLTSAFPNVLIESCSGGGGRFDAGMLAYTSQIWTSDNTDALSRMQIQYGTSLAYPLSTMGAHVSAVPNHQTQRNMSMKTRSLLAMCGTFGYELDSRKWTDEDKAEIKSYIDIFKNISDLIYTGDLYRIWSPFKSKSMAWMVVSQNKKRAIAFAFKLQREMGRLEPRLKTCGLDPDKVYRVTELCPRTLVIDKANGALKHVPEGVPMFENGLELKGRTLEKAGLPVSFLFDGDSICYEFNAK